MLFALSRAIRGLCRGFIFFGGLLLGAALRPAAPALRLVLRRKRSRKRAPKPCPNQPRYNERLETALMGTSRWVILRLRSRRPWGQKKNSRFIFCYARKNEAQGQGLSIFWDGQPLASDCRSFADRSLLFEHNAVQTASWLAKGLGGPGDRGGAGGLVCYSCPGPRAVRAGLS